MEIGGHLPFKVEYSKSGRASCKGCKTKIDKDVVRIARMMKSRHHDGVDPNWLHFKCFFGKAKQWGLKAGETHKIEGFHSIRIDDQDMVREACEKIGGPTVIGKGKSARQVLDDFEIGYAPSGRARCRREDCKAEKIEKDELRISAKMVDPEKAHLGPIPRWHHVGCFKKVRSLVGWEDHFTADMMTGFTGLDKAAQDQVRKLLKPKKGATKEVPIKAEVKAEPKDQNLKKQNRLLWAIKDKLQAQITTAGMKDLLSANKIDIPQGEARLLDYCSDLLLFGRLPKCGQCKNGMLCVSSHGYYACNGSISGFTKCDYVSTESGRRPPKIPTNLAEASDYLAKYKYDGKLSRVFPQATSMPPLTEMKIFILGKAKGKKSDLEGEIKKLGGSTTAVLNETVHFCVMEKDQFEGISADEGHKFHDKLLKCETFNLSVVNRTVLEDLKKATPKLGEKRVDVLTIVKGHQLSDFGECKQPGKRKWVDPLEEANRRESKKIKLTVQNGAAIDPEAYEEVPEGSSIVEHKGKLYTAMLTMVNLQRDKNSYYKLQAIGNRTNSRFFLFRSWGRIGSDTIGGTKIQTFHNVHNCTAEFEALFEEKSGNNFFAKTYVKLPDCMFPMELDYAVEDKKVDLSADHEVKSELKEEVQDLIKLIFNVNVMKKGLIEMDLDLEKMPLGKLSKDQLKKAWVILNDIMDLIVVDNRSLIKDKTTQFYHLVPHVLKFGETLPILSTPEIVKEKIQIVDNLIEIETAYSILDAVKEEAVEKNPIDTHYEKLKTDIAPISPDEEEYSIIDEYVKTTHAKTHQDYSLEINNVFKIDRNKEAKKFKPFSKFENRQLLWHGSRLTNYAGILSQGLRIAPPEAPVTGYMFGKGIYFADMVSKSANYCFASPGNNRGLLLLGEVALGNMHELNAAEYIQKLPKGCHSVKGIGSTHPDPASFRELPNGCRVPCGKGVNSGAKDATLLYNEYIVYDVAQVNLKYLVDFKFKFKETLPW